MTTTIFKATKVYEGRVVETEYAFDLATAKARIRNHVHLNAPAEWTEVSETGRVKCVLTNTSDDVEVEVNEHRIHGDPQDA